VIGSIATIRSPATVKPTTAKAASIRVFTRTAVRWAQSPVGWTVAGSTIRITVRFGARGRWRTPLGIVTPCWGEDERVLSLDVDVQLAFEHEEELVLRFVLVPVEVALDHPEPDDRLVHGRQRLVEPGLDARRLRADVDPLQLAVLVVEVDPVVARLRCLLDG
jgi:hypothetical protein